MSEIKTNKELKIRPIDEAILELSNNDKISDIIENLRDCSHPKWERILRSLVNELTDKTVYF